MKPKIYLAGPGYELDYRYYCKNKYSEFFDLYDPMRDGEDEIYKKNGLTLQDALNDRSIITKDMARLIVEKDKQEIKQSDILLAYLNEPTFGTSMEIVFGYSCNKYIYTINPNKKWICDPWLSYHSNGLFETIDGCFNHLLEYKIGIRNK
jgi:nucleoside 2-deoxyribosyltransferase